MWHFDVGPLQKCGGKAVTVSLPSLYLEDIFWLLEVGAKIECTVA